MKFETLDELVKYLATNDMEISDLEFDDTVGMDTDSEMDSIEPVEDEPMDNEPMDNEPMDDESDMVECVKVLSLASSPIMEHHINNGEHNILYVKSVVVIKESCGAGNIVLNESTLYLNICNENDETTTKMNLEIDGQRIVGVPLVLKESLEEKISLSKKWLNNTTS